MTTWTFIGGDGVTRMGFQRSDDYQAPTWPDPTMPQQMHIDIEVDDLAAADREVQDLGATKLASDGKDFSCNLDTSPAVPTSGSTTSAPT